MSGWRHGRLWACLCALLLVPVAASCDGRKYKLPVEPLVVSAGGQQVAVSAELAVTQEERNWGFMERKRIPDGTGMLFVFERDQVLSFWMKDTPHPLSIAYIDSRGVIVDLYDMTPYSLADVTSTRSVRFAMEVPQGWFDKNGIRQGDTVTRADGTPLSTLLR